MPLDPPSYIGLLDNSNPRGTDSRTIADDSIRNLKESVRMSLPNVTGEVTATHGDLNLSSGLAAAGSKILVGTAGATVLYFYNDTVPVGWTLEQPDPNNSWQLIIGPSGSGEGGTYGGTDDPYYFSDTITVSISGTTEPANLDGHYHGAGSLYAPRATSDGGTDTGGGAFARDSHTHSVLGSTASTSGTNHAHSAGQLVGSGSTYYSPRYARGILGKLNA